MKNLILGEKIRSIRVLKGLSQENMAELLDMSVRGYGAIERGATDIPFSRLQQIANKLDMSVADLLAFGDRVSNFFDRCSSVIAGVNNGGQTANSYESLQLKHQVEKLTLELKKLQAEKEKAETEARYWNEKYTSIIEKRS